MAIPPARYECTVHIENGQLCNDELLLPSYPNAGIKCTDATIATSGARFDNHVDIGMASIYAKLRDPCEVSLLPMGKPPVGGSDKLGAMVAVELDNGHGVAIPVVLNIDRNTEGCGADLECTAEGALVDTQLTACAQALPKPTVVPGFPDGADDPTLTADMREIWFNVNDAEIWYANRASVLVAFGAPARVAQLESTIASVTTHSPHVSPDGLTMYLTSSRSPSAGGSDIFIAKRQNRTAPWSQPILISELSSTNVEGGASVDGAGLQMVIARRSDTGVQEFDLFVTSRGAATDAWDTPTLQTTISDPAVDDLNPHLTEDGLHVYFYRNVGNPGATEIFGADRMDLNAPFGAPHRIVQLSSLMNDTDPWVSPDGNTIYFASDRNGVSQIFIARR